MSGQDDKLHTPGVERYLGQIKRLEEDGQRCTATLIAQTLDVSLPSASEMLKRLSDEAYLIRHKDGSLHLTKHGRPLAHIVVRRHRLVERLLTDILEAPWHDVHEEAERIEHAISSKVEELLMQRLGFPEYCPHGHPICPVDLRELRPLTSVESGEEVGVAQISETKADMLGYLDRAGVKPGSIIKVIEAPEHSQPLILETQTGRVPLGTEVAAFVQTCPPQQADWINRHSV